MSKQLIRTDTEERCTTVALQYGVVDIGHWCADHAGTWTFVLSRVGLIYRTYIYESHHFRDSKTYITGPVPHT
jgi:hypothetical protein